MILKPKPVKHGLKTRDNPHPLYRIWIGMKKRCYCKTATRYSDYGGRGIKVCDEWKHSVVQFIKDMGPRPEGMTLERKENNGDYCPKNCVWATQKEQHRNTRSNRFVTIGGETKIIKEWSETTGMSYSIITQRLNRGWTPEDAINIPPKKVGRPRKQTMKESNLDLEMETPTGFLKLKESH